MNSGIIDSVLSKRGVVAKLAKLPYYSYLPQRRAKEEAVLACCLSLAV